jgi:hypothetical protein
LSTFSSRELSETTPRAVPNVSTILGDWPLPTIGGRLHIACNPNQGVFCSRGQKTLKNRLGGFSADLSVVGKPAQADFWVRSESAKGWSENQPA